MGGVIERQALDVTDKSVIVQRNLKLGDLSIWENIASYLPEIYGTFGYNCQMRQKLSDPTVVTDYQYIVIIIIVMNC